MWLKLFAACFAILLLNSNCEFCDANDYPTIGEIIRESDKLDKIISKEAVIEVIASGFDWSEGPVWIPSTKKNTGYLLFSDVPRNHIIKVADGEFPEVFMSPSGFTGVGRHSRERGSNGLILNQNKELLFCEHGDRRVSVLPKNGGKMTVADNYMGKRFNSPNDIIVKSNGVIYFTDPPYGLPRKEGGGVDESKSDLGFFGVYMISTNKEVTLVTKEFTRPNGIAVSPDEKTLYLAQSDPKAAIWKSFPIQEDGTIGEGKILYDATKWVGKRKGLPDGMAVSADGTIFATGPGGVWIFAPSGEVLGRIDTGQNTSNCAFGGDDFSTLYITADQYILKVSTKTEGVRAYSHALNK